MKRIDINPVVLPKVGDYIILYDDVNGTIMARRGLFHIDLWGFYTIIGGRFMVKRGVKTL